MVLRDPCVGGVFVGYSGDWVKVPSPSGDARAVLGNLPGADTVNSVCGVVLAHEVRYAASGTFCCGVVFSEFSSDWLEAPSPSAGTGAVLGSLAGADMIDPVCGVAMAYEVRYAASGIFSCGVVFSESSSDLLEAPSPNVATGAVLGSLSGADTVDSLCGVALVYEVTCFAASGAFFGGREPQAKG